jgi:L-rhamnose mutarotase
MALDLANDPILIEEYKQHHRNVWPEIKQSLTSVGVLQMEIYLVGNRLFMIMETEDSFSLEEKALSDAANIKVQEWERLMWRYQVALPQAKLGQKWIPAEKIYEFDANPSVVSIQ